MYPLISFFHYIKQNENVGKFRKRTLHFVFNMTSQFHKVITRKHNCLDPKFVHCNGTNWVQIQIEIFCIVNVFHFYVTHFKIHFMIVYKISSSTKRHIGQLSNFFSVKYTNFLTQQS